MRGLRQIAAVLRPWRVPLLFAVACATGGALLELAPPLLLRAIVDDHLDRRQVAGLLQLALLYLAATVGIQSAGFAVNYLIAIVAQGSLHAARFADAFLPIRCAGCRSKAPPRHRRPERAPAGNAVRKRDGPRVRARELFRRAISPDPRFGAGRVRPDGGVLRAVLAGDVALGRPVFCGAPVGLRARSVRRLVHLRGHAYGVRVAVPAVLQTAHRAR